MASVLTVGFLVILMGAITIYLLSSMVRAIRNEKDSASGSIWKNFGLSLAFCILFFLSWFGHGVAEWNEYKSDQKAHHEKVYVKDFTVVFASSTLENWQSEFLQLYAFVVMSALFIHRGSAESKDSDDRMEEQLKQINERLKSIEAT